MIKKQTLIIFLLLSVLSPTTVLRAQPRYDIQSLQREKFNRGVVAVRSENKVVVSWRLLTSDAVNQPFDVYRNGKKLNTRPLTSGGTFFVDNQPLQRDATYEVRGGGKNGAYKLPAKAPDGYIPVKLQRPEGGVTPDGQQYVYSANDASVADVDGDGQYEIVLKWDPSNAHDNAHDGYTGPTIFDCYRLDGKLLWRIDMGINIRSGAHYVPFIFYDLDGDGRAEFMVRTSDGTRDGVGQVIGDASADYRHRPTTDAQQPSPQREWGKYNRQGRPMTGRILSGNEYITVFNGLTGKAMCTKPYVPERGNLNDWGDNYANRSDRMLAAVGYFDGRHASAVFCRGYYTRTVLAAWDWDGSELRQRWVFDTNTPQWAAYAGQGNHNLRVADVDGDGCDEIIYGSMAVDHNGSGLYNTGMGHGDAIHLMAFSPSSPELQVWDCHENRRDGSSFRNARTGEVIFQVPSTNDVGRCMAADIDPTNPGLEMWSSDSHGIRGINGKVVFTAHDPADPQHQQHLVLGGRHLSINFGIWWDGDLLRELLDHGTVSKYDWQNHTIVDVVKFPGVVFNNGTKSNPCLSADILGDWREEVIARTPDSDELRIFVSPVPTDYRITCLMEDIPYRLSVATQNVGYNQPSEPGFYLGEGMQFPTFDAISLAGKWCFSMGDTPQYNDTVTLPGSMLTNGKGIPVSVHTQWTGSLYDSSFYFNPYMEKYRHEGQMKFPFFLTPERHYVGNAWYKRSVVVPKSWSGRRVVLYLERPHIETTVFVNNQQVGHQMSLSTPHQYDITSYIKAGSTNEIAICVYNGIENVGVGQDSQSVTDQTQGNWNGIVGRIELQAQPVIYRKKVVPNIADKSVDITINEQTFHLSLGADAELWDEFHPRLYTRTVNYQGVDIPVTFGLRQISARGRQLYINGRQLYLRGTVENCCFPETGFPPTTEAEWLRIFRKCKEYGLNHVRFHSYCPPEAAFSAADQVGIYLQPEGPSWPNHGVKLRRGQNIDQYLLEESKRIVDTYGHHPSFVMMTAGNEPAGDWVAYCNDWVQTMHNYDSTKLYCGASVGGGWAWDDGSEYHVKGGARGLDWDNHAPQSSDDYYSQIEFPRNYKAATPNNTPIIAHEQGQWCAFPDFKEIPQYTGVYKARNFEIFRDLLHDNGMEQQAEKFLMASGKLQTLAYKYEIERNLRTKDYAGFQLLALNDYSGQGTALEGVLNVHWRSKGYTSASEWREFCSPVVPLARFPKFVYTNADTLSVPVEVYNASGSSLSGVEATWRVGDVSGTLPETDVALGKNTQLGVVSLSLARFTAPTKLTLTVQLSPDVQNHWDFWVYPEEVKSVEVKSEKLYIADSLDSRAIKVLERGGKVLLTAAGKVSLGSDVVQHYLPVFWNTSWFKMRPPHTTGAYIDNTHPLFKYGFPTDDWSNLNWWQLLNRAQVMNLMELPASYQSPIQPIDTWHVSRKLGMLVEANVLNGMLLITTMDVTSDLDRRIVARQMRSAILAYMGSDDFKPTLSLSPEIISHFFTRQAPKVDMYTRESPDELKPKIAEAQKPSVEWDRHSLIIGGKRVVPAMGEVHYSRIPASEWQHEVLKMKEGGITMLACYVFWNHIEEVEGQFDWTGERNLRAFLEVCKRADMPVVLRVGPFCHGEVRNGGIPDWLFTKGCKSRSLDPVFLKYVERLYRQIFTQFQGLQWKDGGPVIACQFDNEYRGSGEYLMALKRIATEIGFNLPFYTRTGWPELASPVPFGEMIPLYGDYADGFWERSIEETAGNYYKAFNFTASQVSGAIGSEQLDYSAKVTANRLYPYFTCELGGGMMPAYHRRPYLYPDDAYSMAVVKLGSGSNLLGYYMYHGGTNPDGKLSYLNETQRTPATNYNDMPVKTYDFQAPLGEFGQTNPHYYMLRKLHLFMHDWGDVLAPMEPVFPCAQDIPKGCDTHLRWCIRSNGGSGFIFINNYERLQQLSAKRGVQLEACGVKLPKLDVPAGTVCIFPVNISGIKYATAQLIAQRDGKIYLQQIPGIPTTIAVDGRVLRNLKPQGTDKPVYGNLYLLTSTQAEHLFLSEDETFHSSLFTFHFSLPTLHFSKLREAAAPRPITIGVNKVAEAPTDADFDRAAIYTITLPDDLSLFTPHSSLLQIDYRGDVARLYADGKLIDDNFYYGRPFQYALWRLPKGCRKLELRILPLQKDKPIYFPREADTTPGEQLKKVSILVRD